MGNSMNWWSIWLPESHENKTLENFDWSKYSKVKDIVDKTSSLENSTGIFMFGGPGVGKTHILVGLFVKFVRDMNLVVGQDILFVQWSDFMYELREVENYEDVLERITGTLKVLIVDDIRQTEGRWLAVLKRLIEKIYEKQIKFFTSTNADDMSEIITKLQLEDYWLSRLKERCVFIQMRGTDRRAHNV